MSRTKEDVALDAIYEGMLILGILTGKTGDPLWMINSAPRNRLDGLAREIGYRNADHVYDTVEIALRAVSTGLVNVHTDEEVIA